MFQWILKKIKEDNRGFTLIELIVVIAIIAILALIAVPRLTGQTIKADVSTHNANVRTLESAATMWLADAGAPSGKVTWKGETGTDGTDEWKGYLQEWPKLPDSIKNALKNVDGYTVTIGKDGQIEVTPGKAVMEEGKIIKIGETEIKETNTEN